MNTIRDIVILAAGFGTRMGEYASTPKALLPLWGTTVLDHTLACINALEASPRVHIVTNGLFFEQFKIWKDRTAQKETEVLLYDNSVMQPKDRNGAVKDLCYVLEHAQLWGTPVTMLASDTFFSEDDMEGIMTQFQLTGNTTIAVQPESRTHVLASSGVVDLDGTNIVTHFEEKPTHPHGTYLAPPLYTFSPHALGLIRESTRNKHKLSAYDSPGLMVAHLLDRGVCVRGHVLTRMRVDMGTLDKYTSLHETTRPSFVH